MAFEKLREMLRLDDAITDAEARKRHYESRLAEITNRWRVPEATRRELIERLEADIYDTDAEIADHRRRMEDLRGVGA